MRNELEPELLGIIRCFLLNKIKPFEQEITHKLIIQELQFQPKR